MAHAGTYVDKLQYHHGTLPHNDISKDSGHISVLFASVVRFSFSAGLVGHTEP
jgi:hypothetical protein